MNTPLLKPSLAIGIAASLASAPLVGLLLDTVHSAPRYAVGLLYLSPVLLALVSVLWYRVLHRSGHGIRPGTWLGVTTALATFFTFVVGFSAMADLLDRQDFETMFRALALGGLYFFGWIAVLAGALAGWIAAQFHAQEG